MPRMLALLRPLLVIALVVGILRFVLSVTHAPRGLVYLSSLTAVEIGGMIYLAIRTGLEKDLGYKDLWAGNLILFGACQLLTIAGLAYTYLSGVPTLYHETERLRGFMGYDPAPVQHIGMHVLNWMIIAPTLATWIFGPPIIYLVRRRAAKAIAGS